MATNDPDRIPPVWSLVLGLAWPCSLEDVKAAYRCRAKATHPDTGGDPHRFALVEEAYRRARVYHRLPFVSSRNCS